MTRMPGRYVLMLVSALLAAVSVPLAGVQAATTSASAGHATAEAATSHGNAAVWSMPSWLAIPSGRPAGARAPAGFAFLDGVFCTSAASCWAVGEQGNGQGVVNQALRWNGKTWRKVAVPNPGGTATDDVSELYAVRCQAARDCWAVGEYTKGSASANEALHWNGKKWSSVRTPAPGGSAKGNVNELFDSTCTSSANCWAVGDYGNSSGPAEKRLNEILHWNGKKWSRAHAPNPGGTRAGHVNSLFAVRCLSSANCLAVGVYGTTAASTYVVRNEALHWNGRRWSLVSAPDPGSTAFGGFSTLSALACGSPTSCWGAGSYGSYEPTQTSLNEILHWNGRKWTKAAIPNPGGTGTGAINELIGATCTSSRDCWAVGTYHNVAGVFVNEALHWNGRRWSLVSAPNPGGTGKDDLNILAAARCTSSANCWAVGIKQTGSGLYLDEILHWNGKKWSVR